MDMQANALTTEAEQGFVEHFDAARAKLPGADNAWARELRDQAMREYAAIGLPSRRVEEWKYTDLRRLLGEAYAPAPALSEALSRDDIRGILGEGLAALDCHSVILVDGHLRHELTDFGFAGKKGEVTSLGSALASPPNWLKTAFGKVNPPESDAVLALNAAFMNDGVALRIPDAIEVTKPIHIIHVHAAKRPASVTTRNFVSIGKGAKVTLIESFFSVSDAASQHNVATELDVGDGARVNHVKVQRENQEAIHLATWMTRLGASADYKAFQFTTGAALSRSQIFLRFAGENASGNVSGAFLLRDRQHHDTTLVVDHTVAHCESRELFKAVLDDEARGVFQGKIEVHPHAQKTDAKQMAQGLLLSEAAEFDSKPELVIFADDVVCGHGSTSGQIDEDSMFYLRSRGIGEAQARSLLIQAFAGEAIDLVEDEVLRDVLLGTVADWLAEREQ